MTMKGFMRGAVGVLVGGAMGLWGCNSEVSSQGSRGFQDPVQTQHRPPEAQASMTDTTNASEVEDADPARGGRPYDSDRVGSTALPGTGGSGRQPGGSTLELGTGLADSYRGPAATAGTGGAGMDAGTRMDAGTAMDAGTRMDAGTMDAGRRR
ncbi:hypothetical protein D7X12_21510 [Corallococcus sicarius]|uniref:Uncharacterized protein n=2 Tax=Corallococcus sicarius TaxID=2316726 RepID=A0A3A8NJN5_9BACT|nr:hypothetical protein D7X12_21510 [Corallococcus sicarius]